MSSKRQVLLLSASAPFGFTYLQYAYKYIHDLCSRNNVTEVLFIPYALRDHDFYTSKIKMIFKFWGYQLRGIHNFDDPISAIESAQTIFIGSGNTFQLLNDLYSNKVLEAIRKRVLVDGIPYIGSGAGTNVATINICTTNDMPIVHVPSFDALGLVPFNINTSYRDPLSNESCHGETRRQHILEYLQIPGTGPVLGLKEGTVLWVDGNTAILKGLASAKLFVSGKTVQEYEVGSDLSFLLTEGHL